MNVYTIEEFAAKRRKRQDDDIAALRVLAAKWLEDITNGNLLDEMLAHVVEIYRETYTDSGGDGEPAIARFLEVIGRIIDNTDAETDVDVLTVLLVIAAENAATVQAASDDPEFLLLEWVTMHDDKVRDTHQDVAGERRPPGETWSVGGVDLPYPGYPKGDPAVWINCRCTLAPVLGSEVFTGFRDVSTEERKRDAKAGRAMPDGSYPIDNCQDLKNAIQAIGRAKNPGAVKSHIRRRKSSLGCPDVPIPDSWSITEETKMFDTFSITPTEPPPNSVCSHEECRELPTMSVTSDTEGWSALYCPKHAAEHEDKALPIDVEAATQVGTAENYERVVEDEDEVEPQALVAEPTPWHGVLAPEGIWSGDGRRFAAESLSFRNLPLPLTWQKTTDEGHDGSVVVAKIERIARVGGEMRASGSFLFNAEADEVIGMIAEFGKFGVSVDADDGEFEIDEESSKITFTSARICSASIVSIPAFAEAFVALGEGPDGWIEEGSEIEPEEMVASAAFAPPGKRGPGWITDPVATKRIYDYWTKPGEEGFIKVGWGKGGDFNRCRVLVGEKIAANSPEDLRFLNNICAQWHKDVLGIWPGEHLSAAETVPGHKARGIGLVASGQKKAPSAWFADPKLGEPTHLTVTEDGRVFGHIAEWTTCHIGYEGVCVSPPHSASDYAYFANKSVLLDDGEFARTGVICLGGKHAALGLRSAAATAHYDTTSKAIADVAVGEDDYGIWCAGWIRPGTDEDLVVALRGSDVSGDWRHIGGTPEMVAALAVNTGGFPVAAAKVTAGVTMSLVAAGGIHPTPDPLDEIADRIIARMEARDQELAEKAKVRAAKIMELRGRFAQGEEG